MDKLKMHSPDLAAANIERLAELFPGCVTESRGDDGAVKRAIDFDLLRQELSDHIVEGPQERYRLDWPGKREALLAANAPIAKTLRPCREESVDFDTTQNLFIEGDNLDALKLLQETYLGKVKMIYIDPPYNTGNDFIYEDDFEETSKSYLDRSNQKSGDGRLVANTESNGRFHSDWLNMMYPRLRLARNFLRDEGVVCISIDDNESHSLRALCDDIFGHENHLITFYIQVRYANKTLAEKNDYQKIIEQVILYQKKDFHPNKESEDYLIDKFCWKIVEKSCGKTVSIGNRSVDIFLDGEYEIEKVESHIDGLKETWATGTVLKANASGKYFGDHLAPRKEVDGLGTLYKVSGIGEDGLGYRYFTGPKRAAATKGTFFSGVPSVRRAELEAGESKKFKPVLNWHDFSDAFGNCRHEGGVDFGAGKKPLALLKMLVSMCTDSSAGDIVLDFFAGSGTTGHAVIEKNLEDQGNRRYVLVQLPEVVDDGKYPTISSMTEARLRNAALEVKSKVGLFRADAGFRVLKIDTSNMAEVYYTPDALKQQDLLDMVDNVRPGRTSEDLLFQVLLDWGVDLTLPIAREEIAGREVFFVDNNALAACFVSDGSVDEAFVKELAKRKPLRAVFRDAGFANDNARINVEQIFKTLSPNTEVKTL